ncbi:TonB protein [Glycocaulis alkaliphilus]|uniref:Protein TonB n=1 Tax=Glycocaulis alkaliphilus TaxID=1434191 RepID=A0A3T0E979_9PROT|nr:energy transducer TonB [Glycocaulis alkaliphilus]AZU03983.1 TonB protein [Glycocaulis alkaliphilus]GGB74846.1 hypothetical protein GCM10007417_13320 [Glycocaulis alkaliphilus]
MQKIIIAALAALCVSAGGYAIPPGVLAAFDAYMDAVEANDLVGAVPHAEAAWQAASRGGVDTETLAVLAENRAEIYVLTGDHARAGAAWQDLAGVLEQDNAEAEERARAYVSAAVQYALARDLPAAITAADAAIVLYPQDAVSNRLFLALRVKAVSEWAQGQLGPAGVAADRAMRVREQIGASVDSTTMTTAMIAAVHHILGRNRVDAAFYISIASDLAAVLPADDENRLMLWGWSSFLRSLLSDTEREALYERRFNSALLDFDDPGRQERERAQEEGVEDARPLRRDHPRYPQQMLERGVNGVAVVMFDVTEEGRPENVRVAMSIPHADFGREAVRAVQRWRYTPRTENGVAVRREGVVTSFDYQISQ